MSPGSIKWLARCPNLNVAKAPRSQTTCQAVSDACLHLSHWGLFTRLSLNGCPFEWRRPVRNLVNILRWFLLRLSNSPVLFAERFSRKPLSCLCSQTDCQHFSCFLLVHSLISPVATFADIQSTDPGPVSACEEPCQANSAVISLPSIPMCPHTHTTWILLCFASFTRDWWQSQTNLEFIWRLTWAWMAAWMSERIQMFLHL